MIRINLIAGERRSAKATAPSFQVGQKVTVLGSLFLVLTAVLIGWRYWAIAQEQAQVQRDIDQAKREESRMAEVLKQVSDFEARRAQLQQRVALIDELRKGQNAPVHMIDQISRAVPDMMWLVSLKQDGYDVTIEGRCLQYTELSDFVSNLVASRYFRKPVDIVESSVQPAASQGGPPLIKFVVKGSFQMAGIEPPAAAGKKPAPVPARGGRS